MQGLLSDQVFSQPFEQSNCTHWTSLHFEEFAVVAENRYIDCGSFSTHVLGQTEGRRIFKTRCLLKYHVFFDVASNKRHAPCVPFEVRNRHFNFGRNPMSR